MNRIKKSSPKNWTHLKFYIRNPLILLIWLIRNPFSIKLLILTLIFKVSRPTSPEPRRLHGRIITPLIKIYINFSCVFLTSFSNSWICFTFSSNNCLFTIKRQNKSLEIFPPLRLQFYTRNPFKNESDKETKLSKKLKSPSILQKK